MKQGIFIILLALTISSFVGAQELPNITSVEEGSVIASLPDSVVSPSLSIEKISERKFNKTKMILSITTIALVSAQMTSGNSALDNKRVYICSEFSIILGFLALVIDGRE